MDLPLRHFGLFLSFSVSLLLSGCSGDDSGLSPNSDDSSEISSSDEGGSSGGSLSSEIPGGSSGGNLSSGGGNSSIASSSSSSSSYLSLSSWETPTCVATGGTIGADDPCILYYGRWDRSTNPVAPAAGWSGTYVKMRFNGTGVSIKIGSSGETGYIKQIDGGEFEKFNAPNGTNTVALATGLAPGEHEIAVYRRSEGSFGMYSVQGFEVEGGTVIAPNPPRARLVECMGNSITAGFAADAPSNSLATNNTLTAWCVQSALKLGADWSVVAHSGQGMYQNLNGTGQTEYGHIITMFDEYQWTHFPGWSAAPPYDWQYNGSGNRVQWDWSYIPDVAIYAIGTNDYITFGADPDAFNAAFKAKYKEFLTMVRSHYPKERTAIFLHGILLPDEWSPHGKWDHANRTVEALVAELNSAGDERVYAINPRPNYSNTGMWLEDNAIDYNGDRTHPSIRGHQIVSDSVSAIVRRTLGW